MKTAKSLKKISYWPYVKPHLWWLLAGPLVVTFDGILEIIQPALMAKIVDDGINGVGITDAQRMEIILQTGGVMILLALLAIALGIGGVFFTAEGTFRFGASLRRALYHRVQAYSFSNIDRFSSASLVTRLTNDVTNLQNTLMSSLRMFTRTGVMLTGALVSAILINARLALLTAFAIPVIFVIILVVVKKGLPYFEKMQRAIDGLNRRIQETVSNIRVIKSFVREDHERKRFDLSAENLFNITVKASGLMVTVMPAMMLVMNLTTIGVLWFGGQQVVAGEMQVGALMSYSTYIMHILMSLMMLSMTIMMFSRAKASSERIKEVLSEEPDIADGQDADRRPVNSGLVEFRHVSFRYTADAADDVLHNITFTARPGEVIAVVGATGSAKSFLVNLIPRLYDVTEGAVLVDGRNVRDYAIETLRDGIGLVPQKNLLFTGTIRDNIRWGRPDATDEEVEAAAKAAQAHDFILSLPDGYDTRLEQGGVNVSGGQKQRLCIARAMIKKPPILILDDSTSAVDSDTESRIRASFASDLTGTTVFLIAQRISSIRSADRILILDGGRMAGFGTHEELLTSSGIYQEILESQQKGVSA